MRTNRKNRVNRLAAPAGGPTQRSIGGLDGVGGWDPGGNPIDPGLGYNPPTVGDPRIDAAFDMFNEPADTFSRPSWGNFQPDFNPTPMEQRGWNAFGPFGMQYGAMGPAPNIDPYGRNFNPAPTAYGYHNGQYGPSEAAGSAGASGGYGGFSGGTGSFGGPDGYDSR